ncbi:hypothetical protein [Photobacterium rosenbergii]|uniref:Pilus assembly protein TadD n=1 Tax=Photobacterium rosenbergii TaxID=294936 RepID=A0ABU3ZF13_9GAMM|nr:hypothetical protein [Photobacterium rosenbergii]MDV5168685.1 hypothetical protein [Photobacterium rosenbergii]
MKAREAATRLLLVVLLLGLGGCQNPGQASKQKIETTGSCGDRLSSEQGMAMSMIQQQIMGRHFYSALAELERLPLSPDTRLLKADSYRHLGKWHQAEPLYKQLVGTCLAGRAYHGLGLVSAYQGDTDSAMDWLEQAVSAAPVSADIRNDFGFLLLVMGQDDRAYDQLFTALELEPEHPNAGKNLWFLLLKNEQHRQAETLASRYHWGEQTQQEMLSAISRFRPLALNSTISLGEQK